MRAAVVPLSTVIKNKNRLDAGFFLGMVDHRTGEEIVKEAERRLRQAKSRLKNAKKQREELDSRRQQMIEGGEIIPLN